jgi:hypothetical protein
VKRHPAVAVHSAGIGQEYTLHVHIRLVVAFNLLCDVDKIISKCRNAEKKLVRGIGILVDSQLRQFAIGSPASSGQVTD